MFYVLLVTVKSFLEHAVVECCDCCCCYEVREDIWMVQTGIAFSWTLSQNTLCKRLNMSSSGDLYI